MDGAPQIDSKFLKWFEPGTYYLEVIDTKRSQENCRYCDICFVKNIDFEKDEKVHQYPHRFARKAQKEIAFGVKDEGVSAASLFSLG